MSTTTSKPDMIRLSDTQLVILTHAAAREDLRVLPLPSSIKARGNALKKSLEGLLKKSLIQEIRAWRDDPHWRTDDKEHRQGLKLTKAGLGAIGIEAGAQSTSPAEAASDTADINVPELHRKTSSRGAQSRLESTSPRQNTKADKVLALLKRPKGATLEDLTKAIDWQAHSVRGFLSGTLKKRMGLTVLSEKDDKGTRRYRIEAEADA